MRSYWLSSGDCEMTKTPSLSSEVAYYMATPLVVEGQVKHSFVGLEGTLRSLTATQPTRSEVFTTVSSLRSQDGLFYKPGKMEMAS